MFILSTYLTGLGFMAAAAVAVWLLSLAQRDASIVDSLWSVFFIIAGFSYAVAAPEIGPRAAIVLGLVSLWGLRLAAYITWRNWGEGEDRRYQAIRARNEPNFALKSLFIVFLLQAFLAWIVSLPLIGAITAPAPLGALDWAGVALVLVGIYFESVGDLQLTRFKADPENAGKVMDRGLWRYTRHPNYFGDFCVWWGFYLVALGGGAWWSFPGPLVMSFFLLKVSGVALLEKDIAGRRPEYVDYVRRTNAFFPGPPRSATSNEELANDG